MLHPVLLQLLPISIRKGKSWIGIKEAARSATILLVWKKALIRLGTKKKKVVNWNFMNSIYILKWVHHQHHIALSQVQSRLVYLQLVFNQVSLSLLHMFFDFLLICTGSCCWSYFGSRLRARARWLGWTGSLSVQVSNALPRRRARSAANFYGLP